jgi:murein DD-endopeptidase MepM/ murein hydrolase activator NlpD
MSKLDCDAITGNWTGWVPGNATCTAEASAGGPSVTSQDSQKNQEIVYNFFRSQHYEPYQAAAIVGNMIVESAVMPQRLQGTAEKEITTAEEFMQRYPEVTKNTRGWGIVQWDPGAKFITNASSVAAANILGTQMQFVADQLDGKTPLPEKQAGIDIRAAPDIREAVLAFQGNTRVGGKYVGYERPLDQSGSVEQRLSNAKSVLTKYGSGNPSMDFGAVMNDPCSSNGLGGGTTIGDGQYALPVPQKFFDSHPDWFSKPHHDYPSADIPVPRGTPVYAAISGKIIIAPANGPGGDACYGHGLYIQSGDIWIVYGHGYDGGSIPGAKQGDTVQAGQLIMHVDNEGCSFGDHLHFDVRVGSRSNRVCPQNWLMAVGRKQTPPDMHNLPSTGCSY